jgi:hypothetical protein
MAATLPGGLLSAQGTIPPDARTGESFTVTAPGQYTAGVELVEQAGIDMWDASPALKTTA